VAVASTQAYGWGAEGHRTVALIATQHLDPAVQARIGELLRAAGTATVVNVKVTGHEFSHLVDMATWADAFRFNHRETGPWHFVDIPITADSYNQGRDCAQLDCVIAKINDFVNTLKDSSASDVDKAVALRFVVHFMGDLHQPLHCADNNDRGGNSVKVLFGGQSSNLHHVWDTELVLAQGGGDQESFANRLNQSISADDISQWSDGSLEDWANESHSQAVQMAYGKLPQSLDEDDLQGSYSGAAGPVIEMQIKKAGIRLATILNAALK
jgi:hypothetical protein